MVQPAAPPKNRPRELRAWCFYDWANSVYSLVIATAIFPIYYFAVTPPQVALLGGSIDRVSLRSYAISVAYLLIVLLGPLLAGRADARRQKKAYLRMACYAGATSCVGLFWFTGDSIYLGLGLFVSATFFFALSDQFYNSFLPEIATPDRFDQLSARGYSLGYVGSVILLVASLVMVQQPAWVGLEAGSATRVSFVLTGLWWAGFGTYTFRHLRADRETAAATPPRSGFAELLHCLRQVPSIPLLGRFLLTFLCYNMGLQTVMNVATDFGTEELKLEAGSLILALLLIQLIAVGGAYFFAMLSEKKGNIFALKTAVLMWVGIIVYAWFVDSAAEFYGLGAAVGWVMGGTQSTSRAAYSRLLPPEVAGNASFFSFYSVLDKVAVIVGTFSFGLVNQLTGSMRNAIIFLALFFVAGFALLALTRWRGRLAVGDPSA